ncbi:MAG: YncE family protein [Bryobacteraceae bacterium]
MTYKLLSLIGLMSLSVWAGGAQTGAIDGPVLGYVMDLPTSSARPLVGIPGAALTGGAIPLGFEAAAAEVSPRQDYILAIAAGSGEARLVRLDSPGATRKIPGLPRAEGLLLSPLGKSAVLWRAGRAEVVAGLPDDPAVAASLDLTALPGAASVLAVSDEGIVVALAGAGLYALVREADPPPLPFSGEVSAAVFGPGSADLYLADRAGSTVSVIRNVTGTPQFRLLAGPAEGIAGPVALAASRDNRRVFVANRDSATIAILGAGPPGLLACDCEVTAMQRLNGEALFRVTGLSGGPAWVLDAGAETRLWFVPPAEGGEAQ